jgi:LDH2 family malate/lactate/ureidoglycolate dehydrogenase
MSDTLRICLCLAGEEVDDPDRTGSLRAMLTIDTDGVFAGRAGRMASYIRSSPPIDPAKPVMLPGEREQRAVLGSSEAPVAIGGPTWAALVAADDRRTKIPRPVSENRPS